MSQVKFPKNFVEGPKTVASWFILQLFLGLAQSSLGTLPAPSRGARAEFESKSDLVTQYFEKGLDAVADAVAVSTKWIKRRLMVAASVGFGQPDLGSVPVMQENTCTRLRESHACDSAQVTQPSPQIFLHI